MYGRCIGIFLNVSRLADVVAAGSTSGKTPLSSTSSSSSNHSNSSYTRTVARRDNSRLYLQQKRFFLGGFRSIWRWIFRRGAHVDHRWFRAVRHRTLLRFSASKIQIVLARFRAFFTIGLLSLAATREFAFGRGQVAIFVFSWGKRKAVNFCSVI